MILIWISAPKFRIRLVLCAGAFRPFVLRILGESFSPHVQRWGFGSNTWPDGTVYHGTWRANCPSGPGEYTLNGGGRGLAGPLITWSCRWLNDSDSGISFLWWSSCFFGLAAFHMFHLPRLASWQVQTSKVSGRSRPLMVTKLNFREVCSASLDLLEIFGVFGCWSWSDWFVTLWQFYFLKISGVDSSFVWVTSGASANKCTQSGISNFVNLTLWHHCMLLGIGRYEWPDGKTWLATSLWMWQEVEFTNSTCYHSVGHVSNRR